MVNVSPNTGVSEHVGMEQKSLGCALEVPGGLQRGLGCVLPPAGANQPPRSLCWGLAAPLGAAGASVQFGVCWDRGWISVGIGSSGSVLPHSQGPPAVGTVLGPHQD